MKGYRTVLFNMGMTLLAGGTVQFSDLPPGAQHWLTLLVGAWGFVGIFLRLVTRTPIGQKVEAELEKDFGITADQMAEIVAELPQKADIAALVDQGRAVAADIAVVKAATAADPAASLDPGRPVQPHGSGP